jgi:hypothetical protein
MESTGSSIVSKVLVGSLMFVVTLVLFGIIWFLNATLRNKTGKIGKWLAAPIAWPLSYTKWGSEKDLVVSVNAVALEQFNKEVK